MFNIFKHYVIIAEKETGSKLRCLQSDNSGDYTNRAWNTYCEENGISHSMGPPHSPQLNGVADQCNRTLLDRVLPNLFKVKLPVRFWSDAARHAIQAIDLSQSQALPSESCPKVLWTHQKVSHSSLESFGCKAWRILTGPQRVSKLTEKARPCLHLFALSDDDGLMVWEVMSQRAMKSRNLLFQEDVFPGLGSIGKKTEKDWETWEIEVEQSSPLLVVQPQVSHTPPPPLVIIAITPKSSRPLTPPLSKEISKKN